MEKDNLQFTFWLRRYTKAIEGTDKIYFNDVLYTEDELFALYEKLKVTEVDVKGYDTFFTVELRREYFMSLDEVIDYVAKEIIDTAIVIVVRHKNYLEGRDIHLYNQEYNVKEAVQDGTAKQYNTFK